MRVRIVFISLLLALVLCVGITSVSITPTYAQQASPTCSNPNCNPWGFNFHLGKHIFNPPAGFCSVFSCIANFLNGKGYVVECRDARYSLSGGRRGVCSHHHGRWRALYAH